MAEKAAIFRGVALRKGKHSSRDVTLGAELFRLFFLHFLKTTVVLVFWQFFCGFFRGVEQEKKNSATGEEKGDIQENGLCLSV